MSFSPATGTAADATPGRAAGATPGAAADVTPGTAAGAASQGAPVAPPPASRDLNLLPEAMYTPGAQFFARISSTPLADAFDRKASVHAGMSGKMLAAEDISERVEALWNTPRQGQAAAYVHLPYCESKCLYCGFFGGAYTPERGATYLEALLREIEASSARPAVVSAPINALYLGGGTPTALRARELGRLLTALRSTLPLANDCEITVEGRVHHFGPDKIEACLEAGANRFSIGVQTFDTTLRQRLGRIADQEAVRRRLEQLAAYNQAAVIIDLIYGLPGQTPKDWEEDIRIFLDLPLDGVDLYQLNIFPGSALARAVAEGRVPATAPLAEQGVFFERGLALMRGARCRRLSLSHWGRTARERNLYNPLVKRRADCLHYGAGAGGSLQGWFLCNEPDAEKYMQRCIRGEKPAAMVAAPPEDLAAMRIILAQMEECRLNLDDLDAALKAADPEETRDVDAYALYAPLLDNWQQAGLVTRDGPWVELTLAGEFWQVTLAQALIGWQRRRSRGAAAQGA